MENRSRCLSYVLLAEGTNPNTLKTTNAAVFAIKGYIYTKAATDNLAFSAGVAVPALSECLFGVDVDKDGNVTTSQGPSVPTADLAAGTKVLPIPPLSRDKARLGMIRVKCQNAATFTPTVTDLGATDVIDTYLNTFEQPGEGIV